MTFTVGLAGITGRFGRLLSKNLLANPSVSLRGYARNISKIPPDISSSPNVQLFRGEAMDDPAIQPFVAGCDVVICAYLGDDKVMIDGQKKLIDACEAAKVPRYIASDWALDYTKLQLGELWVKDAMIHIKAYLETKQHVKGVHILVGGFMEPVLGPFFGVWNPRVCTLQYWGDGTEIWEGTTYEDAARYTAAVAADPSAIGVKKFLGDRKSIREIAGYLEKYHGVPVNLVSLGSVADLKREMHERHAKNPENWKTYLTLFFMYYWINGSTLVGPDLDNAKYPNINPETWEDYIKNRNLEEISGAFFALAGQ